jgi:DNA repair protein RadC
LLLDSKFWITHEVMVYRGQVGRISVRGAELLKEAVRVNEAANLLGLELLDHIVVGKDSWVSLKRGG